MGGRSVGWVEHEVDEWIEARMRERDQAPRVNEGQPKVQQETLAPFAAERAS
jgi:hypothetical protein